MSHLPVDLGNLEPSSGLGGSTGQGRCTAGGKGLGSRGGRAWGEYLGSRGGGGRKLGFVTITGVPGCEGGEQFGVTNSPLFGDRLLTCGE